MEQLILKSKCDLEHYKAQDVNGAWGIYMPSSCGIWTSHGAPGIWRISGAARRLAGGVQAPTRRLSALPGLQQETPDERKAKMQQLDIHQGVARNIVVRIASDGMGLTWRAAARRPPLRKRAGSMAI